MVISGTSLLDVLRRQCPSLTSDFDPPYLQVPNKADLKGYQAIIKETGIEKWIFFSDITKEVDAAEEAGMTAYVVVREGNAPLTLSDVQTHKVLYSLSGIVELFN